MSLKRRNIRLVIAEWHGRAWHIQRWRTRIALLLGQLADHAWGAWKQEIKIISRLIDAPPTLLDAREVSRSADAFFDAKLPIVFKVWDKIGFCKNF